MTTYIKDLERRASSAESSAKAVRAYKDKVASLTSERAKLLVAPPKTLRPFCITFTSSSKPWTSAMPTLVLLFYGYSSLYLFSFPVFFYDPC